MSDLEERVKQLEERMTALEGQVQELPSVPFVPEDSINGVCKDLRPCGNPFR